MSKPKNRNNPLFPIFAEMVGEAIPHEVRGPMHSDVQLYLADLLTDFVHTDRLYSIRNREGIRLSSVYEMLAEGDVLLNADSFDREREVHKHVGDYILFWTGVNPDHLGRLKLDDRTHIRCDYAEQGKQSYNIVSSFNHDPYAEEAPIFRELSDGFQAYAAVLRSVGRHLPFAAS